MRRFLFALAVGSLFVGLAAGPAVACGGLIGRNGSVNLVRTTTLAGYHDGVEHYVTSFQFAGSGGEFGSIIPLPDVPTDVVRGGDWTLQRLVREVAPRDETVALRATANAAAGDSAQVLIEKRIDALDITVLKGGAQAVGQWATDHGFLLTPDAPEVLEFYASRSPIFLAARFDADAARQRGVALGDGTPVHITIPTSNPWVPLRILALGRQPAERVDADVFLLTDNQPTLLPGNDAPGMKLQRQERASASLLRDLRSDKGMAWVPESSWLTFLRIQAAPGELTYDLAVDASGAGNPSRTAAGLDKPAIGGFVGSDGGNGMTWPIVIGGGLALLVGLVGVAWIATGRRSTGGGQGQGAAAA
ncbi:MAG: DUF2330 domain-containing protein [Acidimicrobiales bacterium]